MKWICAPALAAVLLFACTKTETTTETSGTSTETAMTSTTAVSTDTSSTVVPAPTPTTTTPTTTMTTNPASGTSATTSTTSAAPTNTDTTATGITGPTGSTTTTHTENMETSGTMISSGSDLVADGLATYKAKGCTGCHGATGAADTAIGKKNNIRDFHSPDVQKQSDEELTRILKEGKGTVSKAAHKSKNLTDLQTKALVAWIRTLK